MSDEVMEEIDSLLSTYNESPIREMRAAAVHKLARIAREEHADNARLREALIAIRDGEFDDLDIDDGRHTMSARDCARVALRGGEAKDGE